MRRLLAPVAVLVALAVLLAVVASGGGTRRATNGMIRSSPVVANGVVFVGSEDSSLYAFDASGATDCSGAPKTCSPLWSYATGAYLNAPAAIANGSVYLGASNGNLYAFGL